MPFKIGVTTGLYTIARGEELATAVRKIGYALTRGASAIEIAMDAPHEITETEGEEIRYIAKKQGIDILLHGSLTIPMCIPERSEWRDAHDHIQKSIRSAVYCGAKYVNFHASLNVWLELMTYAGRKVTMAFCDHEGRFISHILAECEDLREWFVNERWSEYAIDVLTPEERQQISAKVTIERGEYWLRQQIEDARKRIEKKYEPLLEEAKKSGDVNRINQLVSEMKKEISDAEKRLHERVSIENAQLYEKYSKDAIRKKLKEKGKWESEDLRAIVGVIDGYHIMTRYLFYTRDPIWIEMEKLYRDVLNKYNYDPKNKKWLDEAWEKAEEENDRKFKEFYYGVAAAKFLEGHIKKALEWMENDLIKKELKGKPELIDIAKNLQIVIESPDARDPTHAGLYLLWEPRQIYVAIKVIRKVLKTNRVWMLIDFEHIATQGLDPIKELEKISKEIDDFGELTLACHSNAPNPSHAHLPLELGDVRIYKLLYYLRKTGLGRNKSVYLIYERGGGDDPFKQSVEVLRLCVKYLELDVKPEDLPLEFFGVKGEVAGDIIRQSQIIREHAFEPLKDLLEMPEEEWGLFSSTAVKKGRGEVWKKEKWR